MLMISNSSYFVLWFVIFVANIWVEQMQIKNPISKSRSFILAHFMRICQLASLKNSSKYVSESKLKTFCSK